jgi:hypothetical protein
MKKIIALLLAVLYMTTSSGVVLNVHYCMGKVSSVKVDNFNTAFCKCGVQKEDGSCCKTEVKVCKLANEHKGTIASGNVNVPIVSVVTQPSLIDGGELKRRVTVFPTGNAPPGVAAKTYIENCVFRI